MSNYEAIIGMEVHAQLLTHSKMFCGCDANVFGAEPNTHVCPVCLGLPGALPVINRRAVEQAVLVGLALNCRIAETAIFSRKNYFYPDLPKSYQISMYDFPLCQQGWLEIEGEAGSTRRIRIRRVHLEEDTGKLFHAGDYSLVDFNRSGVPLLEIVTEPDLRTPEEARHYLIKLRTILRYLGVSSGDMEKGAMRCEANVSVRPVGAQRFGTKVEVKNLNSFRAVKLALDYEIARQIQILEQGGQIRQVTMGWNEGRGRTVEQRAKEEANDYRYFPEPDLPPLCISRAWVDELAARLPELPDARRTRFIKEYGLSSSEATVLTADRDVADYFEAAVQAGRERGIPPRSISHWLTGELFRLLKAENMEINQTRVTPVALAELVALVETGAITAHSGKEILQEMFTTGRSAGEIAKGATQVDNQEALALIVERVLAANPEQVNRYRAGKTTLLNWFVGEVMKATRGKANPQIVNALLEKKLNL
ncbi:MAG: Asp-tRNA(Asn)/Glu-tRNA(Gln) amidotransferase subunit GatB [Anaerolineae bacterium]